MTPRGNRTEEFCGKVVCVAGSSRGIGRAVAQAFAGCRARLLLLARSGEVFDTARALETSTEVLPAACDVREYDRVREAIARAMDRWGRIDVLVNSAAVLGATGEIWTTDPKEWASAIDVNLSGAYHTMRAALPHMIRAKSGKVVNFAGGGAAYGYPKFSAYPGAIETDLLAAVRTAGGEVRTLGTMKQAVELVLFLASSSANHLSGRFIHSRDSYRWFPQDISDDAYTLRRVEP
jgi:NADP-dependent 3-hydroxy acid dehydrogenase YdfG